MLPASSRISRFLFDGTRGLINSAHDGPTRRAGRSPIHTRKVEMHAVHDYRYVITCSSLPRAFKTEFRKLVRSRIGKGFDPRTGATFLISNEKQCRRVAILLHGFQVLRAGGFAPQTPWNFRSKHLHYLIGRWLSEGVDGQELTDRITHLRLFVRWIGKYALLDELKIYAVGAGAGDSSARTGHLASGIDIPLLTREKVMETLYEQRGDLRKTARALGSSTRMVSLAVSEGQPFSGLPPGLSILP
jgi:hypothetical protein